MDPEVVQVWNYTIENDLKELFDTTYTNEMQLLFGSLLLKNSIVKHA